jgi:hypothetical protein
MRDMSSLSNWIDEWGLVLGVGSMMTAMTFIMWDLAKQSDAGKFGTVVIFISLGLGILGFIIKLAIQYGMESAGR